MRACSSRLATGTAAVKHVLFDLDGTLYDLLSSGLDEIWTKKIICYIERNLKLPTSEAVALKDKYYRTYGLTILGLMKHNHVDPRHYCADVYDVPIEECLKPDPALRKVLEELRRMQYNLWIFTNAPAAHALRVLKAIDCVEPFHSADGAFQVVDSYTQWDYSKPDFQNKPATVAYECMKHAMRSQPTDEIIMVEDSMVNLEVPRRLGWSTIWVAYARPVPAETHCHHVVQSCHSLLCAVDSIEEERKALAAQQH